MQCPACYNPLSEIQVGRLKVDVCQGGCGGIWFDAFELQQVDEQDEAAGEALFQIERDESIVLDATRKRACPRCPEVKLYRHWFSTKVRVQVDECPNCGGYWLDAGELAQIRSAISDRAEDTPGRTGLSSEVIRYLYRLQSHE